MTRTLSFSRAFVLAVTLGSLVLGLACPLLIKAQNRKESLGTFPSPTNLRVENVKISSESPGSSTDSQSVRNKGQLTEKISNLSAGDGQVVVPEGNFLGLSIAPKASTFGLEVTSFLAERNLALSSEAVRISSDRAELIARGIHSEQTTITPEKSIHFALYGTVDGKDYSYFYEFVYDDDTKQLLRGSAITLSGDGYEVDYETGEAFRLRGGNEVSHNSKFPQRSNESLYRTHHVSASLAATTTSDLDCILNNLKSCSTYFDVIKCFVTLGTSCLNDFLRAVGLDVFCNISVFCQPLPSFNLSASPSTVTVRQGQTGSVSVQATFTGGWSGSVSSFSVTSFPGVSTSFSPGTISSSGGRVNLNISVSASAPTGSKTLTISGTGAGKTKTTTVQLKIDSGRGTIQINGAVNGSPWSGSVGWALTGAGVAGGAAVPRTLTDMTAGAYGMTFLWGGPANSALANISPNSQSLNAGSTVTFTFNFVTSPNPPSNLTSSAISSSQIALSWNDNSNNETEFRIDRKRTSSGIWSEIAQVGSNVRNYTSSGLSSNTVYFYRVRAANQAGKSGYSNESSGTTRR